MDFGQALNALKNGTDVKVTRVGWNGANMHVALQLPDGHSKMELPYLYMFTAQGKHVPWVASQSDLLAEDWMLV